MFYQILPHRKWNDALILLINMVYKDGIYEFPRELLNASPVPSPPAKMKTLLTLSKIPLKIEIKPSPQCAISHEN